MNLRSSRKSSAFTLIEILVALLIFAIIGVLSAISLHSMIRTQARLQKADDQFTQLEIAMTWMRRDLAQVIDKKIQDGTAQSQSAFLMPDAADIVFIRAGESDLHRVGYGLRGKKLVRFTWDTLDQASKTQPAQRVLLNHVESLRWQLWPSKKTIGADLPKAVLMVMRVKNEGVIQGVFPIPARGFDAAA